MIEKGSERAFIEAERNRKKSSGFNVFFFKSIYFAMSSTVSLRSLQMRETDTRDKPALMVVQGKPAVIR